VAEKPAVRRSPPVRRSGRGERSWKLPEVIRYGIITEESVDQQNLTATWAAKVADRG
jgi:hypothetical protein